MGILEDRRRRRDELQGVLDEIESGRGSSGQEPCNRIKRFSFDIEGGKFRLQPGAEAYLLA